MKQMPLLLLTVGLAVGLSGSVRGQSARLVQFDLIDFAAGEVSLHNFGTSAQNLSGWRFCSHDADQVRVYTPAAALNGVILLPGQSLRISYNNAFADADPLTRNLSEFGGLFAGPLGALNPYGLQVYADLDGAGISFGNPADLVDHLQWSPGGLPNLSADERSDEAFAAGLWGSFDDWINTAAGTTQLRFIGDPNNLLSGSPNFQVVPEPSAVLLLLAGAAVAAGWRRWRRR